MADLNPLIRLRKHSVDQKQKLLSGLYRQVENIERQKQELREQIVRERHIVEEQEMLEAFAYFGRFTEGVKIKIARYDQQLKELEHRIEIARTDLRDAFADLKKIEITKNRRDADALKAENRKETKELDEIGVQRHKHDE